MTESTAATQPAPVVAGSPQVLRMRDFVGWDAVDREGEKVGSVADLLIDLRGQVRFLDVEYGLPRRHILLPAAAMDWGDGRFIVRSWTREQIRALPSYDPTWTLDAPLLDELVRAFPWMYDPNAEGWQVPSAEPRVVPLSAAKGFELETGAPDLRGWNVFGSDGERLGTVSQLLVDPASLKVRFLDVDLLDDLYLLEDDRHVLVPLEAVDLKERGNDIWVRALPAARVARLPAYLGGAVSAAMEAVVRRDL